MIIVRQRIRTRALTTITIPVPVPIRARARSFTRSLSPTYYKQKDFRTPWTTATHFPYSNFVLTFARSMSGTASKISIQELGDGKIEILDSLERLRAWRKKATLEDKDVGFVPTMGALHDGHLSLVRESLVHNPLTVVSIFVNPAQFAPHEDLATYPRTIERDIQLLLQTESDPRSQSQSQSGSQFEIANDKRLAVFIPSVREMYPSGITQDVNEQRGTFIRIQGYEDEMEGKARPGFFRGVATVVMKLFNAVEPTQAYFGQKDIQQALLLRRLCSDVLLSHPLPEKLHIVPTGRDPTTGLALSSRNAYLTEKEYKWAPVLWNAILKGRAIWESSFDKDGVYVNTSDKTGESSLRERVIAAANKHILETAEKAKEEGAEIRLNYVELNWADTFKIVDDEGLSVLGRGGAEAEGKEGKRAMILSGAVWVGKTRLIDNMILGDTGNIIS